MKSILVLGMIALASPPAFANLGQGGVTPCIGTEYSATCDISYQDSDGQESRQIFVGTSTGYQNPSSQEKCEPPYLGYRSDAQLTGDYQQAGSLFAGTYHLQGKDEVIEDDQRGVFIIPHFQYPEGATELYDRIDFFPQVEISFRTPSTQA